MRLSYNCENNRYCVLDENGFIKDKGLHCGECLKVLHDNKWIDDRIEMKCNGTWYLVETKLQDEELEGLKVKLE